MLSRVSEQLLSFTNSESWPALLFRVWKLYTFGTSLVGATTMGVAGLRAGFGMGKTLVEEQTGLLLKMLTAMAGLFGTPYAELLWFQAVACLSFALVTEMVYVTVFGLVAGSVLGFLRGYVTAVTSTLAVAGQCLSRTLLASRGVARLATVAWRWPWQALRAAALFAVRALPARLL